MSDSKTETTVELLPMDAPSERPVNSVDATAHQPIVDRVMARKEELEQLLATVAEDDRSREDIALALSTIEPLLTGDLSRVPAVVAADLNRWLERNKHVGESSVRAQGEDAAPVN
jgi:hypothetical protein